MTCQPSSCSGYVFFRVYTGVCEIVIGALYHPLKAQYRLLKLQEYIDECSGEIADKFPTALVILAGDFNSFPEDDIVALCAFNSILTKATRSSKLDQIYISEPYFANVKVVASTVKNDHMVVIAYSGGKIKLINKC